MSDWANDAAQITMCPSFKDTTKSTTEAAPQSAQATLSSTEPVQEVTSPKTTTATPKAPVCGKKKTNIIIPKHSPASSDSKSQDAPPAGIRVHIAMLFGIFY
ncbi:hypothetical protein PG989_016288 [Apiospora arundinis]